MNPTTPRPAADRLRLVMVAIMAAVGSAIATTVALGLVHDLSTAGSLFSIFAFPMTVAVYYAARLLYRRIKRTRMSEMLEEDARNREHVVATVNLCLALATGATQSNGASAAGTGMSMMRHIATHMGEIRANYGHYLSETGRALVEDARDAALAALSSGSCASTDFADIVTRLSRIDGQILELDDPFLAARRRRVAGIEDPPPE